VKRIFLIKYERKEFFEEDKGIKLFLDFNYFKIQFVYIQTHKFLDDFQLFDHSNQHSYPQKI